MGKPIKKVAVLMGGWTSEREISLTSGGAVCKALEEMDIEVLAIDVQRDAQGLLDRLTKQANGKINVIFNALHGKAGEDGTIQGFLDIIGIPYTHSGLLASAIAMNKFVAKTIIEQAGVPCTKGKIVSYDEITKNGYPYPAPFVVKPIDEGSSVGVRVILKEEDIATIEEDGWIYGPHVLVEKYVQGRELTASILGNYKEIKTLGVTELRPKHAAFYDYKAKYSDNQTDHLLPAPIPEDIAQTIQDHAIKAYRALGCNGAARADFRWNDSLPGTEGLFLLEVNTQPGLTPLSLLPEQASYAGMSFNELIMWILEHPLCPA